jgi:hypothetical protein
LPTISEKACLMLFALGMFVFDSQTLLPDRYDRDRAWRHARDDRFLAPAASQFVGPGEDKCSFSGVLVPELAGSASAIETLAEMANEGEAWPLMDGTGTVLGTFTIERHPWRVGPDRHRAGPQDRLPHRTDAGRLMARSDGHLPYSQPRAAWRVTLDGADLTATLAPRLISLRLSEKTGEEADSLEIVVHDTDAGLCRPVRAPRSPSRWAGRAARAFRWALSKKGASPSTSCHGPARPTA